MKVVVQRSKEAAVTADGQLIGSIDKGLVLLVGITHDDTETDVRWMADKIAGLRIFEDESGKMNHSVVEIGGAILSVSQFTLYGDRPEQAEGLYMLFNEALRASGLHVATGQFGAMMDVSLVNWGPVTLIIDSKN